MIKTSFACVFSKQTYCYNFAFINGRVCIYRMWFIRVLTELENLTLSRQVGSRKLHEEIFFLKIVFFK